MPGTQHLGYAVLPATGTATGTFAVILGGPGQASTSAAKAVGTLLEPLRGSYDLLLVDQRGTGLSGELKCTGMTTRLTAASVRSCATALGAARQFLTPRADADDLEAVRTALGIEKISLLGVSYGTAVAGYYARLFPQHTDRVVLDSPEPIEGADALDSLRELALPRVLREVCWPPSCRTFLAANPVAALAALADKLRKAPLSGTIVTATGKRIKARFAATALYALAAASDVDPFIRTRIPSAVASALKGDAAPLLRLAAGAPASDTPSDINPVRLLATNCIDDRLPWDPGLADDRPREGADQEIAARPKASWGPFSPTSVLSLSVASVCTAWPSTPATEKVPFGGPGRAGARAGRPRGPAHAARGRAAHRRAVPERARARRAGHRPLGALLRRDAVRHHRRDRVPHRWLRGQLHAHLAHPRPVPVRPGGGEEPAAGRRPEGRRGPHGHGGRRDAARRAAARAGAQGGGRHAQRRAARRDAARRGHARAAEGYSLVRGIVVSGSVPLTTTGTGAIVVTGPDAVAARLTLKGARLSGTLGTHKVRLRVVL